MSTNLETYPSLRRSRERITRKIQSTRVNIRLFPEELERMRQCAKRAGKTLSSYLRDCALAPETVSESVTFENLSALPVSIPQEEKKMFPPLETNHEALESTNQDKSAGTFVSENVLPIARQTNSDLQAGGSRDLISEKTGHAIACDCFVCARLRELLAR